MIKAENFRKEKLTIFFRLDYIASVDSSYSPFILIFILLLICCHLVYIFFFIFVFSEKPFWDENKVCMYVCMYSAFLT